MKQSARIRRHHEAAARLLHRGFTLIELLVVIAVIGVLVAVLVPALSSASFSAKSAKAASNMRQLVIGHGAYAADNDDVSIPGRMAKIGHGSNPVNHYSVGNGEHYRPRWMVTMGASAGFFAYNVPSIDDSKENDNNRHVEHEVFVDPTAPHMTNNRNYAFGYNFQFLGNSRQRELSNQFVNFPVRVSRVGSQTVLFAPNLGTAATFAEDGRQAYNPEPHPNKDDREMGNHGWSLDPPRLTADSDNCTGSRDGMTRSAIDERHAGGANVAWIDGHVALHTARDLGYVQNADGSFAYSSDDATNRHFSGRGDLDPPSVR